MLEALKRFHNAEQMINEQTDQQSYIESRVRNVRSFINTIGTDFSKANIQALNERVDELIIESKVLSDRSLTVDLSPHALKALGFGHSSLIVEVYGKIPGWFKRDVYLFDLLGSWKIGKGAPAKIIENLVLETVFDLNEYYHKTHGASILTGP